MGLASRIPRTQRYFWITTTQNSLIILTSFPGRYLTLGGIAANAMRIKYADSFEGVETMLPRELKDFYLAH
uniref:Uncharacterized protein n=1 Tax=Caenorhabditis japonica TaxID=281687 RepID=A0A8R1ELK7_CAEJA